ncbi:hypothetical protein BJV77DRAFT_1152221 [Russula vinacea]|nr:hypothetical protein BJV77DRAFT_1152221 [Russula vinacea]
MMSENCLLLFPVPIKAMAEYSSNHQAEQAARRRLNDIEKGTRTVGARDGFEVATVKAMPARAPMLVTLHLTMLRDASANRLGVAGSAAQDAPFSILTLSISLRFLATPLTVTTNAALSLLVVALGTFAGSQAVCSIVMTMAMLESFSLTEKPSRTDMGYPLQIEGACSDVTAVGGSTCSLTMSSSALCRHATFDGTNIHRAEQERITTKRRKFDPRAPAKLASWAVPPPQEVAAGDDRRRVPSWVFSEARSPSQRQVFECLLRTDPYTEYSPFMVAVLKEAEHQELGFTNAARDLETARNLRATGQNVTMAPFTEDLPSNKRQTEAGHVLPLADSAEDDSEAVVTLLNYPKRVVSREKPRPKSAFLPLLQQKTAMHLDIKGVFALNASWCKTWTR